MTEFILNTSMGPCAIKIGAGIRRSLAELAATFAGKNRIAIMADENVSSLYGEFMNGVLTGISPVPEWIVIPAGERSKSIIGLENAIQHLVDMRFGRDDVLISFGGGVVGDLAGFIASVYLRGVKWMIVPTTLMSQADASIGGKVAIHFGGYKNVLGAFHQPSIVLIDPEFLLTLPTREFQSGLAEVIKMAILPGGEGFKIWDTSIHENIFKRDPALLASVVEDACRMKASIVEKDEFDRAGRMVLNLGHTLGHALESVTGFDRYTHGEAVCIGILFMCELSHSHKDMSDDDLEKIRNLYAPIARETPTIEKDWNELAGAIDRDKKWRASGLKWVYPLGIGKIAVREIPEQETKDAWERFRSEFSRRFGRVR